MTRHKGETAAPAAPAAAVPPLYTFKPVSNYAHTAKEVSTNSTPEAFVREVVVHNTYDADATWIRAAPLVGTDVVGVLVADNGHGMSRPVRQDSKGDLVDAKGKYPGINAFFDVGNSTRSTEPNRVGRKGHGSKLALQSDREMTLITKSQASCTVWDVVQIANPMQHLFDSRAPELTVKQFSAKQVMDLLMAEGEFASTRGGLAPVLSPTVPASQTRVRVHVREIVQEYLTHKTGTLLVVLGLAIKDLKEALDELDRFSGYEALTLNAEKPSNNDKLRLPAYIRFKTICGHPLIKRSLLEADYVKEEINRESTLKALFEDDSRLSQLDFKILTKGPDDVSEQDAFTLKEVPIGYPYIPLKTANRDRQNRKSGSKALQGKSSDPLIIKDWHNAAFQERYLKSFKMRDGSQTMFVLQLEVIGKYDRLNTWSMLNRRGGATQKRSGVAATEFHGVLLYSSGVYTCRFQELLDAPQLAQYSALKTRMDHWDLKIIGDLTLRSDRDSIAAPTKELLGNSNFLENVKEVLDHFAARNRGYNMFNHLVRRLNQDHQLEAAESANQEWDARAKTIKDTQPRLIVSLKGHPPMLFLQPLSGEENGVIQIYTTLFGCLPDSHFTGDLAPLKSWWPMLLSSSGAAGIDSFGVDRDVVKSLNFSTLDVPMPISKLRSIEFKRTFRIPDCKPQGNKVSSGTYNHPWPLTDMLICWDMKWDKAHQLANDKIDVPEETYLYDKHGNIGEMTEEVESYGECHTIPDSMRGYAFFVANVKDRDGNVAMYPVERTNNNFTLVVCLKRLIQVTFTTEVADEPVGKVTWTPRGTCPDGDGDLDDLDAEVETSGGPSKPPARKQKKRKHSKTQEQDEPEHAADEAGPSSSVQAPARQQVANTGGAKAPAKKQRKRTAPNRTAASRDNSSQQPAKVDDSFIDLT